LWGIAGYSLFVGSSVPRSLAAQALLAGIAERGDDAVGYAYRRDAEVVAVHKRQTGASGLIDDLIVPDDATQLLVHVRDFTKGHPSLDVNNHPIRHGSVVGIHNGVIANDEEILARHRFEREWPGMTVDSEAIFALVEKAANDPRCLEELHGTMATAWLHDHAPRTLFLARGIGRPLWIAQTREGSFFASTSAALTVVERSLRTALRHREVPEGTFLTLVDGRVRSRRRFLPDRSFREERRLPEVRSRHEGDYCLQRMAVLAAWTMA
jgi:glucosamine 6-phosphate synthetase-like amidotransferase/phosphosugar isomerase protein